MKKIKITAVLTVSEEVYAEEFKNIVEDPSINEESKQEMLAQEGVFEAEFTAELIEDTDDSSDGN